MSGKVVWFTGLSGAGKTTICRQVAEALSGQSIKNYILDADCVRQGLCSDLGYSLEDRKENIRRMAHVADLIAADGTLVLVAAITPTAEMRDLIRNVIPDVLEVYVEASLAVCEERDVKGLYHLARAGEIPSMTGIDSPYEAPTRYHVVCRTAYESEVESARHVMKLFFPHQK